MTDTWAIKIKYGRDMHTVSVSPTSTLAELRSAIFEETGLEPGCQKIMYRGVMKDEDKLLQDFKLKNNAKIMLYGIPLGEAMDLQQKGQQAQIQVMLEETVTNVTNSGPDLSVIEDRIHKRVYEDGPPADVLEAIPGAQIALPQNGITGLLNQSNQASRLTFDYSTSQFYIATNSTRVAVPFFSVTDIIDFPIPEHPNYRIIEFKISGRQSSLFIYWLPQQYLRSLKIAILGYQ